MLYLIQQGRLELMKSDSESKINDPVFNLTSTSKTSKS